VYREALARHPDHPAFLYFLSSVLTWLEEPDDVAELAERLGEVEPEWALTYLALHGQADDRGDEVTARTTLAKAVEVADTEDSRECYEISGWLRGHQDMEDEHIRLLRAVTRDLPMLWWAPLRLGLLLQGRGDPSAERIIGIARHRMRLAGHRDIEATIESTRDWMKGRADEETPRHRRSFLTWLRGE
jgi:hypothetical protein